MEAAEHEISRTRIEDVFLTITVPKDFIEREAFWANLQLGRWVSSSRLTDAELLITLRDLSPNQWPDPDGDCNRTCILKQETTHKIQDQILIS